MVRIPWIPGKGFVHWPGLYLADGVFIFFIHQVVAWKLKLILIDGFKKQIEPECATPNVSTYANDHSANTLLKYVKLCEVILLKTRQYWLVLFRDEMVPRCAWHQRSQIKCFMRGTCFMLAEQTFLHNCCNKDLRIYSWTWRTLNSVNAIRRNTLYLIRMARERAGNFIVVKWNFII